MYLSVIVPAYNEEKRIPNTLFSVHDYLSKQSYDYEIIVVSDGSTDTTSEIISNLKSSKDPWSTGFYGFKIGNLKLIDNKLNKGKGAAVKQGMLEARGDFRLFTDADNSTTIDQIEKFWPYICGEAGASSEQSERSERGRKGASEVEVASECYDIVIGSIETRGAKITEHAQWYRRMLGKWSKYIIRIVAGLWDIHDTQRGFKLFTAKAAQDIFSRSKIDRFGFDIEVLALAKKLGYKIKEVPVDWNNPSESKVSFKSYLEVFKDLMRIRFYLWTGKY